MNLKEILVSLILAGGAVVIFLQQKSIYRLQRQMDYVFHQPNFVVLGADGIGELEEEAEKAVLKIMNEREAEWDRINKDVDRRW